MLPEWLLSFECCAVPFGEVCARVVGALEKLGEHVGGCVGASHVVVAEEKLFEVLTVEGARRA